MPTPREQARALRIKHVRETFAGDTTMRTPLFVLQTIEQSRADIEAKRQHLEASGHFTAAGVNDKLKELRAAHAKSLATLSARLESGAASLLKATAPAYELPPDAQRILDHFNAAAPAKRQQLLNAAMSGDDDELARVLIHPGNRRFVDVQPQVLAHMERRYVNEAAAAAATPKLEAYQLAHESLSETIADLSAEAN